MTSVSQRTQPPTSFDQVPCTLAFSNKMLRHLQRVLQRSRSNGTLIRPTAGNSSASSIAVSPARQAASAAAAVAASLAPTTASLASCLDQLEQHQQQQQSRDASSTALDDDGALSPASPTVAARRVKFSESSVAPPLSLSTFEQQAAMHQNRALALVEAARNHLIPPRSLRIKHVPLWIDAVTKTNRKGWPQERIGLLDGASFSMFQMDGKYSRCVLLQDVVEILVLYPPGHKMAIAGSAAVVHADPSVTATAASGHQSEEMQQKKGMSSSSFLSVPKHLSNSAAVGGNSNSGLAAGGVGSAAAAKRTRESIIVRCRLAPQTHSVSVAVKPLEQQAPPKKHEQEKQSEQQQEEQKQEQKPEEREGQKAQNDDGNDDDDAEKHKTQVDDSAAAAKPAGEAAASSTAKEATTTAASSATPAAATTTTSTTVSSVHQQTCFDIRFECSSDRAQNELLAAFRQLHIPVIEAQTEASKTFSLAKIVGLDSGSSSSAGASDSSRPLLPFFSDDFNKHHHKSKRGATAVTTSSSSASAAAATATLRVTVSEDTPFQLVRPAEYDTVRNAAMSAAQMLVVTEFAMQCRACCHSASPEASTAASKGCKNNNNSAGCFSQSFAFDPTLPVATQLKSGVFLEPAAEKQRRIAELTSLGRGVSIFASATAATAKPAAAAESVPTLWDSNLVPRLSFKDADEAFGMLARQRAIAASNERQQKNKQQLLGRDGKLLDSQRPLDEFPSWRNARKMIKEEEREAAQRNAQANMSAENAELDRRRRRNNSFFDVSDTASTASTLAYSRGRFSVEEDPVEVEATSATTIFPAAISFISAANLVANDGGSQQQQQQQKMLRAMLQNNNADDAWEGVKRSVVASVVSSHTQQQQQQQQALASSSNQLSMSSSFNSPFRGVSANNAGATANSAAATAARPPVLNRLDLLGTPKGTPARK